MSRAETLASTPSYPPSNGENTHEQWGNGVFYPQPTHREFVEWLQRQNNQFKIRIKVDNEEGIQAKDVLSYFQQLFDAYSGSDRQGLRVGYYTKRSRGEYHHLKRPGRKQFIEGLTQAEIGETVKFFISSEMKNPAACCGVSL